MESGLEQRAMEYRLGTAGFGYREWVGAFYPRDLKATDYLAFYSQYFDTVELDTTFHATPPVELVARWKSVTPEGFRFSVKTPAAITHGNRIDEQAAPMLWFLETMRGLGNKLGVVLLQFPPGFTFEQFGRLSAFLSHLPKDVRFAVEFRHPSWLRDETTALLRSARVAWAVGDYDTTVLPVRVTADFLYIRWIGVHGRFGHLDHEQIDVGERLQWWKTQFERTPRAVKSVWGIVNNDYTGYAIGTCNRMKRLLGLAAREPQAAERGELFG